MKCSEEIIRITKMNVLDRVSKLPTDLIRKIKDTLDIETYTELLLCEKYINKEVKKTVKDQYYDTFVDDVNGTLEAIITNRIPVEVETLNEHTGDPWHFQVYHPLKIPNELQYNIFKEALFKPLEKLVKEDKILVGQRYIGTLRSSAQVTQGLKLKEQRHPLLNEIKNLLYEYHVPEKPSSDNERMLGRYNETLKSVMWQLRQSPTHPRSSHIVYVLKGIRSFNNEFDSKVQRILLNYLKASVVLTKPYCSGLVSKLVKGQTSKDTQIDADREGWKKDLKKAVKEHRMMEREERFEKRRLDLVKRFEIIESRREARRKLREERREKKKAELKKKKEIAKEKERKKKEKAKEKERKKKLLAKLKAKNAKEAEKAAKEAVKRKAKLAAKALKKAAVMERTLTASLPSVRKLFK
jgi:hypothetical protein